MKRSKETSGSKRRPKEAIPAPDDLAAKFREWQRLRNEVRDFERAATHNTETLECHEREIEKNRK
jgi:hypothetical protein